MAAPVAVAVSRLGPDHGELAEPPIYALRVATGLLVASLSVSGSVGPRAAPALLAFAADAGAFPALRGDDVGVAGVGVAPAQVRLRVASQHGAVGGSRSRPW